MTIGDSQNGKAISVARFKLALSLMAKNWHRQGLWMLVFGFALMTVAGAIAQAQQGQTPPTGQATQPGQTQTQTSTPTPTATADESEGKTAGNYLIQQSIEFGYRYSRIGGNLNNYDTFENLQSGMRLFDYSVNMHAIDHRGIFFDDLSFTNFGYGGDPNDVSRLRVSKNKYYDFRAMFRRDKNFWNYDLLANPLNTATVFGTNPTRSIVNSPLALDLSRHMQDYDLTLMPESRLRFRLGYSRNSNGGPASTTIEGYGEPLISQMLLYRTSSYRMGVDYRGIPKTTLSFDEFLTYSKIDQKESDNGFSYQLSNGVPIDLGQVYTASTPWKSTCTITNATSIPFPTVSPTCTALTSFGAVQNPRSSFPTETFRFQSTYFKNFAMTGSIGYSSGNNSISDLAYNITGWSSVGSMVGGPTTAKRVSVNADWSGDYRITDKLHLVDEFAFLDWRSPSMWTNQTTTLFDVPAAAGQTGMLIPISSVTPATFATLCPSTIYKSPLTTLNGPLCPVHTSSSAADFTGEFVSQYLGQRMITNTIELKYDITRRVGFHIGYMYTDRTIADFTATNDTGELYFPGGASGATAANDWLAARGDCAMVAGVLPSVCVLNANGSVQEGTPTSPVPDAGNDTVRNIYQINESAAVFGFLARPTDTLRVSADLMFGYNDNAFTRTSPRQLQSYKIHVAYTPRPWAHIDGAVDIHENRDNVTFVNNLEHGRTYSFVTTLSPSSNLWLDFGFHYMDIFMQTNICFADSGATAIVYTAVCAIPNNGGGGLSTLSFYASKDYYAYGDVMWKPFKRVTAIMGYNGSIVRGNTTFVNLLQPTGTLDFNYLKPFASVAIDIYKGVSYKTSWNYYGYNDHGIASPPLLALLPSQNFNGSNLTFSIKYAF